MYNYAGETRMKKRIGSLIVILLCMLLSIQVLANSVMPNQTENTNSAKESLENSVSSNDSIGNTVSGGDSIIDNESDISNTFSDKEQDYDNYCYQLNANMFEQYVDYLKGLQIDKKEKYDIAKVKHSLGYITEIELKEAEIIVEAISLELESAIDQGNYYKDCLQLRGVEYENGLLKTELIELSKDYQKNFMDNNNNLKEMEQQIALYEQYRNTAGLNEEELVLVNNQIEELNKRKQNYEIELKEYVLRLQLTYKMCCREIENIDNEIEIMKLKIERQKTLLNEGKVVKNSLTELEVLLQQLEYERIKNICEGLRIIFLLENAIEDQSV